MQLALRESERLKQLTESIV